MSNIFPKVNFEGWPRGQHIPACMTCGSACAQCMHSVCTVYATMCWEIWRTCVTVSFCMFMRCSTAHNVLAMLNDVNSASYIKWTKTLNGVNIIFGLGYTGT